MGIQDFNQHYRYLRNQATVSGMGAVKKAALGFGCLSLVIPFLVIEEMAPVAVAVVAGATVMGVAKLVKKMWNSANKGPTFNNTFKPNEDLTNGKDREKTKDLTKTKEVEPILAVSMKKEQENTVVVTPLSKRREEKHKESPAPTTFENTKSKESRPLSDKLINVARPTNGFTMELPKPR